LGGWGVGVWGLGFGPKPQIPNPQSPIPNPHVIFLLKKYSFSNILRLNFIKIKKIKIIYYHNFKYGRRISEF
jgi:hypothetical protein